MRKKIIYIAGPMTGMPDKNIPAFQEAAIGLRAKGYEVRTPVDVEGDGTQEWSWYMKNTLPLLAEADGVALLPGWERSKGARIEFRLAHDLGYDVRRLEEW